MDSITRVLLIGGPGTGKTTLIKYIESRGARVHHEISRQVTLQAQKQGIDQLFLTDPIAFSNQLLDGRIQQYNNAVQGLNFYDRGIPDIPAYHLFTDDPIPDHFHNSCKQYRYDFVFYLPPWKAIYQSDNERYETFEQAQIISNILIEFYTNCNYNPIMIPTGSIDDRYQFILSQLDH